MKKRKKKEKETIRRTWVARSTLDFPFSNKTSTMCSFPSWAAIKRGVVPSFTFKKKIEKWETEKKEKEKENKW